jgi:hypothetical protein
VAARSARRQSLYKEKAGSVTGTERHRHRSNETHSQPGAPILSYSYHRKTLSIQHTQITHTHANVHSTHIPMPCTNIRHNAFMNNFNISLEQTTLTKPILSREIARRISLIEKRLSNYFLDLPAPLHSSPNCIHDTPNRFHFLSQPYQCLLPEVRTVFYPLRLAFGEAH